jgi:putative membrane protein
MKLIWLITFLLAFCWSAITPYDRLTWILEVAPAIVALVLIISTRKKFPLTTLLYSLILAHCLVLMIGGHYSYALVPFFDFFPGERNNFDKLGHFMQGFVPAILAREILIKLRIVNSKTWINFFIISICLAFSASYELLEWAAAVLLGSSAEDFLGTQGYQWDTQSDMLFATIGAVLSLTFLSKIHDSQIQKYEHTTPKSFS